ncbi:MAG TPA: agmatinase [Vicinamibacterales bacterium]|nr:agmatinase [Vicinamibacterales bacterium]
MKSRQRDSSTSPRFAHPATFMRLPHEPELRGADVGILGVPFDSGTSYRSGARLGPREIRSQSSLIRPYSFFQKVSPFERLAVVDAGDVDVPPAGSIEQAHGTIQTHVERVVQAGAIPMTVGGDHSISLPCLRAVSKRHGPLSLIQFDAHIDTWGDYFGGKYFHGSPFRRAIEEGLLREGGYVQVGIRGPMYGEEEDFAFQNAHGVTMLDIGLVKREGVPRIVERIRERVSGPVYVTFDIDAVDPAYAPGTGTPEVGGLTSYEAQELVRGLAGLDVVACDIVEVAPPFDGPGQITALLAANLMFELLCVLARRPASARGESTGS